MAISTIGTDGLASSSVTSAKLASGAPSRSQLPAGTVLQVVYAQTNSPVTVATTTYTDIGLSATITPTSSTSKILAIWDIRSEHPNNNSGYGAQLVRASTNVFTEVAYVVQTAINSGGSATLDIRLKSAWQYLDSPATTSATTYKIQCATNSNLTVYFQSNSCYSHLTLMEIAQ